MQHIATRIEALMQANGLSVATLAEQSGIPRMTLTRRLVRPSAFKMAELEQIADVLDIPLPSLIAAA